MLQTGLIIFVNNFRDELGEGTSNNGAEKPGTSCFYMGHFGAGSQ